MEPNISYALSINIILLMPQPIIMISNALNRSEAIIAAKARIQKIFLSSESDLYVMIPKIKKTRMNPEAIQASISPIID